MALEPGSAQRSPSPVSSGRASPVPRPSRARPDDELLKKDKAYRRYASAVERALSLFETTLQEWADYISFLGRLLKALQAHPSHIKAVPYKETVAKRLAQCLNPTLPSGVHQKALEVYMFVFDLIGVDALSQDLALYLPGLSSTFSFASLSVRPLFLSLLENHLVKADPSSLRPALKGIILALLPGLEDDTSEDFERTLQIVEAFRAAVSENDDSRARSRSGDGYFWQCLFLASITSPSRRQGALAFLIRKLPKLGEPWRKRTSAAPNGSAHADGQDATVPPAAEAMTTPEPGLLIRCFSAGLSDDQVLIQRGFLDLLVTHLPIHCAVLQERAREEDLQRLVAAAVGVVARRDMSLNRRLWMWLVGPDPSQSAENENSPSSPSSPVEGPMTPGGSQGSMRTRYFESFGLHPLVSGLQKMIARRKVSPAERARPFRICLSLMDRWEVGGLVVPEIFMPALDSVREFKTSAPTKEQFNEVSRSASIFFDGVESGLIWGELLGLIATAMRSSACTLKDRLDKLQLAKFIINHFNVREEEMLVVHLPLVTLALLVLLDTEIKGSEDRGIDSTMSHTSLAHDIAQNLIELIPERAFLMASSGGTTTTLSRKNHQWTLRNEEILNGVRKFYVQDQGNLEISNPPFSARDVGELLLRESGNLVKKHLRMENHSSSLESATKLLTVLLRKTPGTEGLDSEELFSVLQEKLSSSLSSGSDSLPFPTLSAITSTVTCLSQSLGDRVLQQDTGYQQRHLTPLLVRHLWTHLSPWNPKYHVESVACIWELQSTVARNEALIEATICGLISEDSIHGTYAVCRADAGRRFSVLWTHMLQMQGKYTEASSEGENVADESRKTAKGYPAAPQFESILGRPLLLLLDALSVEGTELSVFAQGWVHHLASADRLLHFFVRKLITFYQSDPDIDHLKENNAFEPAPSLEAESDTDHLIYYVQTLSNVLRWFAGSTWTTLANVAVNDDDGNDAFLTTRGFEERQSLQVFFARLCLRAIKSPRSAEGLDAQSVAKLRRTALVALHQLLRSPYAAPLVDLQVEGPLIDWLSISTEESHSTIQVLLLDTTLAALRLRPTQEMPTIKSDQARRSSKETMRSASLSISTERGEKEPTYSFQLPPPASLVKCLQKGFAAPSSQLVLDNWVNFLSECLPFYSDTIFQVLIPLVESLCGQISRTFDLLRFAFETPTPAPLVAPEATLISLMNGLEQVLAKAHACLVREEMKSASIKSPEATQGFFGNMVSGVFNTESPQARNVNANNRLTVLLSFQDTVRMCYAIWSWGGHSSIAKKQDPASIASFTYTTLRTRNRARRMLEHLFTAEALECLECLVEIWRTSEGTEDLPSHSVFSLLHVLDGSRPKNTIPAIFNAIYSRTNPNALEPTSKSTFKSDLGGTDVAAFLCGYAQSLDDDAMDEIWADCSTFLKDVLANPFPHRQTLPKLLEFAAILGEKLDNTSFGDQKRMRRELSDLFARLLTALFTTRPMGHSHESSQSVTPLDKVQGVEQQPNSPQRRVTSNNEDVVTILARIVPSLTKSLVESDRVLGAATTISTSVISPMFKAKTFPRNLSESVLELLRQIVRIPNAQKSWKKDVGDAFNEPRFFSQPLSLAQSHWLTLLRSWSINDKDRIIELLSRLSAPTSAGIVFGVGASSARLEADRKTQINLRRIALLVLAADEDFFVVNISSITEKLIELLTATAASSPSSAVRAEIYMVFRALILKTTPLHLAPLWPILTSELHSVLSSLYPEDRSQDLYNQPSLLQACKVLDTLVVMDPDDFQLHEWLFLTDTVDAVDHQGDWQPVALADDLSAELASSASPPLSSAAAHGARSSSMSTTAVRKPLLSGLGGVIDVSSSMAREELVRTVLRPFLSQLSIHAFESTYAMGQPDWKACRDGLLEDLFEEER
ncbi:MAG: hypothetical protein M1833_006821 [Piccolia ochrophora]|nr:MAG: hypothetical protein M1833_006821 [Piccolia ochrophora]